MPPPPMPGIWDRQGRQERRRSWDPAYHAGAPQANPFSPGQSGQWAEAALRVPPTETQPELQQEQRLTRMLLEFKTARCNSERRALAAHDHRCCRFFHSDRDRRRPVFYLDNDGNPSDYCYAAEPCNESFDSARTVCSRGDSCTLCHSSAELLYHPEFFRKRLCHQAMRCPRGQVCAFAHARHELLVPHFSKAEEEDPSEDFITWHFKTQWCPIGGPHDWEVCVYAHTYRDWRRTPSIGYSSWPCPHWMQSVAAGPSELEYEMRCPRGMACSLAHGAKEQLYHPHFYKTSPCSEVSCKRGPLCAFMHGESDARGPAPAPITEEAVAKAMQGPLKWAEATLAHYQPSYCQPPRYHALEEQVSLRRNGKGGKKGSASRRIVWPTDKGAAGKGKGKHGGEWGSAKQRSAQAPRKQYVAQYAAQSAQQWDTSIRQPYCWQMPTSSTGSQIEAAYEPKFYNYSAPVMWTQQQTFDSGLQSFPVTFLSMSDGIPTTQFRQQAEPFRPQAQEDILASSPAISSTTACATPVTELSLHDSSTGFSSAGIFVNLCGVAVERASRIGGGSPRKNAAGAAIRTPSWPGSLGSPRESITPTEPPATPRPGEEVATSSQTSSSIGNTPGSHQPRHSSAERTAERSRLRRLGAHSAEPVLTTPKGQGRLPHLADEAHPFFS